MTAPATEFASLEAFYDDRPERRLSREADYGACWHNGRVNYPMWRVSYIQATGEIYAVRNDMRGVKLLGVIEPDPELCYYATLDRILDGWARPTIMRLSWVKGRLNDKARISQIRDPRPVLADARAKVYPVYRRTSIVGWTHPDSAKVCPAKQHRHRSEETAVSCEFNSQQIAWKRRKTASGELAQHG